MKYELGMRTSLEKSRLFNCFIVLHETLVYVWIFWGREKEKERNAELK